DDNDDGYDGGVYKGDGVSYGSGGDGGGVAWWWQPVRGGDREARGG
ncbi:hypothetical protein Tco_0701787, partial [Tanacetum coccineum]